MLVTGFAVLAFAILAVGFALSLDPVTAGSDRLRRCVQPVVLLAVTAAAAALWATRASVSISLPNRVVGAGWPIVGAISVLALAVTAFTARYILNEYPMSGDEYA